MTALYDSSILPGPLTLCMPVAWMLQCEQKPGNIDNSLFWGGCGEFPFGRVDVYCGCIHARRRVIKTTFTHLTRYF